MPASSCKSLLWTVKDPLIQFVANAIFALALLSIFASSVFAQESSSVNGQIAAGPAGALSQALSAACAQSQTDFAKFLTARNKQAFARMTPAARISLMKRFVLLSQPGKATTTLNVSGRPTVRCDTPPAISFALQNSTFNYVLLHPNVPKDSHYSLSPTFAVAVGSDGSFNATSQNGEAQMVGRITGSQLAGQINGTACNYAFTAEKS